MRAVILLPLCLALVACDEMRRASGPPPAAVPTVVPSAPSPTVTPTPPPEPPELEPTL